MTTAQIQAEALTRATTGQSWANYQTIIAGFTARGIPVDQIAPRENVFTYNAWRALGRQVRKGEKGVRVTTFRPIPEKRDPVTGKLTRPGGRMPWYTTVFHVTQTDAIA
jgi:hypothetical protein